MDIKEGLLLWFTNFFDKKSAGSGVNTHANESAQNEHPLNLARQQLAEELHKLIIKNLKKKQFIQDSKTIFEVLI